MQGLSKLHSKVNPIFLNTLQKVYISRAQVIHSSLLTSTKFYLILLNVGSR